MPAIPIADKTTLDEVKALIGASSPGAAGTDTLFKYLKTLSDYVDTLETQLGINTDAASASGSLHAKVKQLNDVGIQAVITSVNTRQKPRGSAVKGSLYMANTAGFFTALSVAGAGKLIALYAQQSGTVSRHVKLIVDGNLVSWGKTYPVTGLHFPTPDFFACSYGGALEYSFEPRALYAYTGAQYLGRATACAIEFKSSLEVQADDGGNGLTLGWVYVLE